MGIDRKLNKWIWQQVKDFVPDFRSSCQQKSSLYHLDDMILYIENPKDSTRKLLELINEYSKVEEAEVERFYEDL